MMKKTYTLEDFTMESVMKEATGEWSNDIFSGEKCWNINYSDILTFLIQKAGTICKNYASDLFISWSSLENEMKQDGQEYAGGKYLFGFRYQTFSVLVCMIRLRKKILISFCQHLHS